MRLYKRSICLYNNLLKSDLSNNEITIKGVTKLKVNDKEGISTQEIWNDFKMGGLIDSNITQPYKYNVVGSEYEFCLNDFPDMLSIIHSYFEQAKLPISQIKNYKCSLLIFKLYYVEMEQDLPKIEIKVIDFGDSESEQSAPILS